MRGYGGVILVLAAAARLWRGVRGMRGRVPVVMGVVSVRRMGVMSVA